MRTVAPALLPLFRSRAQAELLTWLFLHPEESFSLTDLARKTGASVPTIHREAERLVVASLVNETPVGRNRMLSANVHHPAAEPLARLLELSFGPKQVIAEEFVGIDGVNQALIFGSWAARFAGSPGAPPKDIDVLLIGDGIDRDGVYQAADRAEARLGLPVNPVTRSNAAWSDAGDLLSTQVRASAFVIVSSARQGDPHESLEPRGT